ncbi:MBL fold metallo-hydrolase [Paracoccus cavernae]|uniref:MBL fold metallo-hydrolase n=1 Tax=Paracoccus cavernae TaxID=1571207 RepID=A0ABT8D2D5_9RHOB|nr:MBL fold metallo-hydrolase [Paracoccus cavernae]
MITSAPARAAAPPVGAPTGSSYRFKIGEFEVTALYDGYYPLKTETFVTNQPVEAVIKALDDVFLPPTIVPTPMTPLVINTGKNLVLIDTGNGDLLPDVAGYTAKNMRAAGIDPAAIDTIIISHFHVDHVCGIRLMDGTYQFPNAQIHVPELEWAHWMDDRTSRARPNASRSISIRRAGSSCRSKRMSSVSAMIRRSCPASARSGRPAIPPGIHPSW